MDVADIGYCGYNYSQENTAKEIEHMTNAYVINKNSIKLP